ncbi:hypothetical protein KHA94_21770 [Bacillus sp. FJAT-49705]|uniref:Uncharacterized protein n=1 Tax=Cytobacillus citreus TaxID=2833586 RepID=A0ABS5NY53_9BACI|nr:hypothetical protein [Cytobacillus citreus]MBS4192763.1 hypothetical protein [Cytobacillus citreus]
MTEQKFVDSDTKEAIEELLKAVNHQTAVLWATDCFLNMSFIISNKSIRKMNNLEKRLRGKIN